MCNVYVYVYGMSTLSSQMMLCLGCDYQDQAVLPCHAGAIHYRQRENNLYYKSFKKQRTIIDDILPKPGKGNHSKDRGGSRHYSLTHPTLEKFRVKHPCTGSGIIYVYIYIVLETTNFFWSRKQDCYFQKSLASEVINN